MLGRLFLGFGIFVLMWACKERQVSYSLLFADDTSMLVDNQTIPQAKFQGRNEQGTWSHELNSVVYSKGSWDNGLKKGIWKYDIGEDQFDINYDTYEDPITNFQISFPFNWRIYEKLDPSSVFSASDTTENGDRRTKIFVVLAHDKKKIEQTLPSFNEYYNELAAEDTVLVSQNFKIVGKTRTYFLNLYVLKKYSEELLVLTLLGESNSIIYDVTYKTRNERSEEKLLRFLEMCLTARINDFRLLDPLDQIDKIEKIEVNWELQGV